MSRPIAILQREDGVALPLALVTILIVSALVVAIAQMTIAEVETHRRTDLDVRAQYLAQAGMEHQIYLLKSNKNAGAQALVNYPATAGQEYWYSTAVVCRLLCTSNRESRRWEITATGEVRGSGGGPIMQTRAIRAVVEIAYSGTGANLYQFPTEVTILRWEEVYP